MKLKNQKLSKGHDVLLCFIQDDSVKELEKVLSTLKQNSDALEEEI